MKGKSSYYQALRRIRSVTFDVADGSREGNAAPHPADLYSRSISPETVEDPADQQREPKRSQVDRKTQTSFVGAEDVCTAQERSSLDVAENTTKTDVTGEEDVDTDYVKEDEIETEESTQDIPGGSDVDVIEEKEESQTTKGSEPEPGDPSERPGSLMSSPEPAAEATGSETVNEVCVDDERDTDDDDDVGIREENPKQSCSAEPDVDSSSVLSKRPERLISKKRDDRVRKRESRSLRYLKVLQMSIVTQLKWSWCDSVVVDVAEQNSRH